MQKYRLQLALHAMQMSYLVMGQGKHAKACQMGAYQALCLQHPLRLLRLLSCCWGWDPGCKETSWAAQRSPTACLQQSS